MDDLDLEIQEAVRLARRKVWRGRVATIASVATFFFVAVGGFIAVFELFPEPDVDDFELHRQASKLQQRDVSAEAIASDYASEGRDRSRMRYKVAPVFALAFAAAYFVSKRFKPKD